MTLHDEITALADKWQHDLWPGRIPAIRELREILEQPDADPLTEAETVALAEFALLCGTFITGRWAEVMSDDTEPPDDWQETAAREAVELFSPVALDLLNLRVHAPNVSPANDTISDERVTPE